MDLVWWWVKERKSSPTSCSWTIWRRCCSWEGRRAGWIWFGRVDWRALRRCLTGRKEWWCSVSEQGVSRAHLQPWRNLFGEALLASPPLPEYQLEIWERMWVSTEEVFSLPCKLLSSCYRPSSHELKVCLGNEEREKKGTTCNAAAIKIKN